MIVFLPRFELDKGLIMAGYGAYWRAQRRLFQQHLAGRALVGYLPTVEKEFRECILRVHEHPEDYLEELRMCAGPSLA